MLDRKRSKAEERSFARMLDELESQEADFERFKRSRSLVPPGWHSVERPAAVAFGGVVIVTMLAAESFDPRLIWDQLGDQDG